MALQKAIRQLMLRFLSLYPPYLGAGIRVRHPEPGLFRVHMKLSFLNRNYFGTHFGGSLYSMCDPFFVLALVERLGPGYIVWDKSARIQFLRPGRGRVSAEFRVTEERAAEIREQVEREKTVLPTFEAEVKDEAGKTVARVEKLLYVRKKGLKDERPSSAEG